MVAALEEEGDDVALTAIEVVVDEADEKDVALKGIHVEIRGDVLAAMEGTMESGKSSFVSFLLEKTHRISREVASVGVSDDGGRRGGSENRESAREGDGRRERSPEARRTTSGTKQKAAMRIKKRVGRRSQSSAAVLDGGTSGAEGRRQRREEMGNDRRSLAVILDGGDGG